MTYKVTFKESGVPVDHYTENRIDLMTIVNYGILVADHVTIERVKI